MTESQETMHCKTNHHHYLQNHHTQHQHYRNELDPSSRHEGNGGGAGNHAHRPHHHQDGPDFYSNASKPHKRHPDTDTHISPRTSNVFPADQQPFDFADRGESTETGYNYCPGGNLLRRRSRSTSRRSSMNGAVNGGGGNLNNGMATLSISPSNSTVNSFVAPLTPPPHDTNALDAMEKEQEGIVMKLMHEIQMLKDENKLLKNLLRANSISSPITESPSPTSPYLGYPPSSNPTSSGSSISSISSPSTPFMSQRRATFTTMTNMKRAPANLTYTNSNGSITSVSAFPRSRSGSLSMNWKASTLSPKMSGVPSITLTESFPFDTEYLSLTPRRSSIRNPNGVPSLTIPQKIFSYSNNEEAIDDSLEAGWGPLNLRKGYSPDENSETENKKLKPLKKLHKRSVSDNTDCNISKQNKMDPLALSENNKNADGVSSGLMIRHVSGK